MGPGSVLLCLALLAAVLPWRPGAEGAAAPIAVVSYGDLEKVPPWLLNISIANKAAYAAQHGYAWVYGFNASGAPHTTCRLGDWHPGHQKWPILQWVLQRHPWALWVDIDTVIANASVMVESLWPSSEEVDLLVEPGTERPRSILPPSSKWAKLRKFQYVPPPINSGVMLWRSSRWTDDLLHRMTVDCLADFKWDNRIHGTRTNGDQDTLIKYLQLGKREKFRRLRPGTLQSQPAEMGPGVFIAHFPGSQKARRMARFLRSCPAGAVPGYTPAMAQHVRQFLSAAGSGLSRPAASVPATPAHPTGD